MDASLFERTCFVGSQLYLVRFSQFYRFHQFFQFCRFSLILLISPVWMVLSGARVSGRRVKGVRVKQGEKGQGCPFSFPTLKEESNLHIAVLWFVQNCPNRWTFCICLRNSRCCIKLRLIYAMHRFDWFFSDKVVKNFPSLADI